MSGEVVAGDLADYGWETTGRPRKAACLDYSGVEEVVDEFDSSQLIASFGFFCVLCVSLRISALKLLFNAEIRRDTQRVAELTL